MSQNMSINTNIATNAASEADYYLGCDVAKAKLDVSLINAQSQELWADTIPNETGAITTLLLTIAGHYPEQQLQVIVEATGTYHYALTETSHAVGIPVRVYNPIITKSAIKASVRGKKTDRTDALIIARMGLRGEGRLHVPEPHMTTKHYARGCQKLSILSSSFRQYKQHFTELLGNEITPEAQELLLGIQAAIAEARAQIYKDLAASANGKCFHLLQTIPGIGPYIASSMIGEIQDIRRFQSAKELTAFAGLDPKIRRSGKSLNSTGKLTKRGSSYLRRSIFIAASVARQHDPQFKNLYDRKRAEGKTYTEAICVVARKLLKVVRSVWLNDKPYWLCENEN
jgi:transposase